MREVLEGRRSIQLSYGRILGYSVIQQQLFCNFNHLCFKILGALGAINGWNVETDTDSIRFIDVGPLFTDGIRTGSSPCLRLVPPPKNCWYLPDRVHLLAMSFGIDGRHGNQRCSRLLCKYGVPFRV